MENNETESIKIETVVEPKKEIEVSLFLYIKSPVVLHTTHNLTFYAKCCSLLFGIVISSSSMIWPTFRGSLFDFVRALLSTYLLSVKNDLYLTCLAIRLYAIGESVDALADQLILTLASKLRKIPSLFSFIERLKIFVYMKQLACVLG